MKQFKEFIVNTPTGKRVLMEVDNLFAILRAGYAPDDRNDPLTRIVPVFGTNHMRRAADGIFVNHSQIFAATALLIPEGGKKHVSQIEKDLFYVPVNLHRRFAELKLTGQMCETWLTYDLASGMIYRKTPCEVAAARASS